MGGIEIQGGMADKHGNTVGRCCSSDGETAQRDCPEGTMRIRICPWRVKQGRDLAVGQM